MARKVIGQCCICGNEGQLSYEHVPPEGAFNERTILEADIDYLIRAQSFEEAQNPPTKQNQRGAGRHSLCISCNQLTGGWYVPAYIEWAKQGWQHIYGTPGRLTRQPFEIEVLPVGKQILAMFASACGPSLFKNLPELPRLILNREQAGSPDSIRLFAYYIHPDSSAARQSGITSNLDLDDGGNAKVYAEIAFSPFGYVLSLGNTDPPDQRLVDITFMLHTPARERRTLHLPLAVLEVHTMLPADFRSLDQVVAAYKTV